MVWRTIERPGHFGKEKLNLYGEWDYQFGNGNWKLMWEWGNRFLEKEDALQIYEDSYYNFFLKHPGILLKLTNEARDIYDTATSNIISGMDYNIQETANNHIHDIAIRRAVMRMGWEFKGDKLIQIRKPENGEWSKVLGPYVIPFHISKMISREEIKDYTGYGMWWLEWGVKDSVEHWYQVNKVLRASV